MEREVGSRLGRWLPSGLSGGLCATAMLLAVIVYGPPVNPKWWALMGGILAAAFIAPFVVIPLVEWSIAARKSEEAGGMGPIRRREALYAIVVLALTSATVSYALRALFRRGHLPLKDADPLVEFREPWPLLPDPPDATLGWRERSKILRERVRGVLTLPSERIPLDTAVHRRRRGNGYFVESVTYASEPRSRVTALLYVPDGELPAPAVVVALGHGASKSAFYGQYAGQLYAKMGFVCLVADTIGEEERNALGQLGTRAHDMEWLGTAYTEFVRTRLKRMVMGKIVWDLMRGIDYLETRDEVRGGGIGIAGFSIGALAATCIAMLDPRVEGAVVCGWSFGDRFKKSGRYCTRMSWKEMSRYMSSAEATALTAQHAATSYLIGDSEVLVDPDEGGRGFVRELTADIREAKEILARAGLSSEIEVGIEPGADHRPFFITAPSVAWLQRYLMRPEERKPIPDRTVKFGEWVESFGLAIEPLYNTEAREYGHKAVDIGAVYEDPAVLACFPNRRIPPKEYTMRGWVEAQLEKHGTA